MTNRAGRRRHVVIFAAVMLMTASVISAVVFSKVKRQQQRLEHQQRERVNTIPPVFSKIPSLEVVNATIINPDTAAAGVAVEIRNNSDKLVMAVDLVSGEGGVTRSGLSDEDNPIVVIQPHGTTTIKMNFGEMTPGAPLVVSAVTYSDGTEEGDEASLKVMHTARAHDRAVSRARKAAAKP
jgi:hypothetical protein